MREAAVEAGPSLLEELQVLDWGTWRPPDDPPLLLGTCPRFLAIVLSPGSLLTTLLGPEGKSLVPLLFYSTPPFFKKKIPNGSGLAVEPQMEPCSDD